MELLLTAEAPARKAYPSEVSDDEWAFVAPYLTLCRADAKQRKHDLRELFNALRWMVRTGTQWRFMPNHFPPWAAVHQQTHRCWIAAGVFAARVHELRTVLRLADVTESVRARRTVETAAAALAASEARYRSLTEAVPVQVWTARADGQLDFASARTAAYFGVPTDAVLGSGWGAFVHLDDLPTALTRWDAARAAGAPYETGFRLRRSDGEYRWHLARARRRSRPTRSRRSSSPR